jgi:PIN domain nuclease of toxin-antitoxin system
MTRGLLLDTCTLLWLVADQAKLSRRAVDAIKSAAGTLHVSAATAFEVGVKQARGHITLPVDNPWRWFSEAVARHGLSVVQITARIAIEATRLPPLHRDPCDRLLVATAQRRQLVILTPDERIAAYAGNLVVR